MKEPKAPKEPKEDEGDGATDSVVEEIVVEETSAASAIDFNVPNDRSFTWFVTALGGPGVASEPRVPQSVTSIASPARFVQGPRA